MHRQDIAACALLEHTQQNHIDVKATVNFSYKVVTDYYIPCPLLIRASSSTQLCTYLWMPQVHTEAIRLQTLQLERVERMVTDSQRHTEVELDQLEMRSREAAEQIVHSAVEIARLELQVSQRNK